MLVFKNPYYYTGDYGDAITTHQVGDIALTITVRMTPTPKNDRKTWKLQRENKNKDRLIEADNLFTRQLQQLVNLTPGQLYELNSNTKVERM